MSLAVLAADPAVGATHTTVDGLSLEVIVKGSGHPLLYLHGLGGTDDTMPLIDLLAEKFEVHAPSHPGFGDSELPRNFSTVDDLSYFYLSYLEAKDLKDVVVVGMSFGGWVAAEILVKNTSRISKAILGAPLGIRTADGRKQFVTDIYMLAQPDVNAIMQVGEPNQPDDISKMEPNLLARLLRNREAVSLYGWNPYMYDPKLQQRLHRINVPTLVLWGADDKVASLEYGQTYAAAIPGAKLEVLPAAGHRLFADQTEKAAELIVAFANA